MPTTSDNDQQQQAEPTQRHEPPDSLLCEIEDAAQRFDQAAPQEILRWAVERFRPKLAMACSFGVQSVAMIDMLWRMDLLGDVEVFYLDTGVLFAETHQTRLRVQEKYGFRATRVAPELSWQQQQEKYGGHLYERGVEGINQCCHIRKVEPTRRFLRDKDAWVTGMRRSHSKTREHVPPVLWDYANGCVKINPMIELDDATVWGYVKANEVPYNPLYDQGYPSIGCNTPVCTQPVQEGGDGRSGRWGGQKVECGIHLDGNTIKSLDSSKL